MGKVLTVSIAAYNMEKYIEQTLDSLMDERIIDELEIFVVDDGGTDGTLGIAKRYAERYPQSVILVHKENGGYGTTVNYSIAHATGKYFKLLDGDDWFDRDGLYGLVTALRDCEEDLVITPYFTTEADGSLKEADYPGIKWGTSDSLDNVVNTLKNTFIMQAMTYQTAVLAASGLSLPEHTLYTDMIYSSMPIVRCRRAFFLDCPVYCYRLGREGQSVENAAMLRHLNEYLFVEEEVCRFYEDVKDCDVYNKEYLLRKAASIHRSAVVLLLSAPINGASRNKLIEHEMRIKSVSPAVYEKMAEVGRAGKLLVLFRATNYYLYWAMWVYRKFSKT